MRAALWLNAVMIHLLAAVSLAAAPVAWRFEMRTNLLKQPEAAALWSDGEKPGAAIAVSCSVMEGPKVSFALGFRGLNETSAADAPASTVKQMIALTAAQRLDIEAQLDVNEPLTWTYVATGAQAIAAAQFLAAAPQLNIASDRTSLEVGALSGGEAIQQVLDRCPFKG